MRPTWYDIERRTNERKITETSRLIMKIYKRRKQYQKELGDSRKRSDDLKQITMNFDLPYQSKEEKNPEEFLDLDMLIVEIKRILNIPERSGMKIQWIKTYHMNSKHQEVFINSILRCYITILLSSEYKYGNIKFSSSL